MPTLSAIIIVRNEASALGACLDALAFCDEIVVVDGGSDDGTAAIARDRGAIVAVHADWPGFGPQKQRALARARGDWVLSIDADEHVPPALAAEIRAAVAAGDRDGYRINRLSSFLGHPMRHGGWYPDRVLRLARRSMASFTPDLVHERLVVAGRIGDLQAQLLHNSYVSIGEVLEKQRLYALAGAEERRRRGEGGGLAAAVTRAGFAFVRGFVLLGGVLDGRAGFVAAVSRAQETFWRHLAAGWER